ncbi:hypothetical protein [Pseudomonas viridiflava]|uniref:hypothetical protein n=1 Tax=Pseudomonas viridiflava TaxID=33069 RepID=UPI001C311C82|nr:hypothetical protein [Pseudomonas viridiflava]QXG49188.1 hypothetical protein KTT57_09290 [Pseudomonas viridiflava]
MSIKATASTLIITAMALVGDYSTVQSSTPSAIAYESPHKSSGLGSLQSTIARLKEGFLDLDRIYGQAVKAAYESGRFDEERYARNIELLHAVRTLETSLKNANVPTELASDHVELRRAIAKTRNRLAVLDNFYRQFFVSYEEFESLAPAAGLKALADHTTRRLGEIA